MKSSVISLLGKSPPVVTSFIKGFWEPVSDAVILYTGEEEVRAGFNLVTTAIEQNYPDIRVHGIEIPFEDVSGENETFSFMSIAAWTIKNEREIFKCERVYLNVSGGRKNMGIALSTLGQIMGVDGIFHIVSEDVGIVNQRLEALRYDINKFLETDRNEWAEMYNSKRDEFDSLLFPDTSTFQIIRIPTLPYPKSYFLRLVTALKSDIESLSTEEKILLWRSGILDKTGRRYSLSDFGRKFVEMLLGK